MDHDTFARAVRESLEHLHNRGYLATHALAQALGPRGQPLAGEAVRQELLDAIEQARPLAGNSASDSDWRRYRHLVLRHVEGHSLDQIASELGVSARQASRDYQQAVTAVASFLAVRRTARATPVAEIAEQNAPEPRSTTAVQRDQGALSGPDDENVANLADTLDGVVATLDRLAATRHLSFTVSVPDTLPLVALSRTTLRQALLNLLMYAIDVAPGAEVLLAGTDTTRGVTLRIIPRSSEAVLADSPRRPDRSAKTNDLLQTGASILETQGGSVELGSASGADAAFADLLKIVLPPIQLHQVLVIDDNPDVVALFRRFLRDEPFRVIQATSAASAVRLAHDLRPDVVVLDVILPSQDGWEILQQLRGDGSLRDIPVIVCSVLPERALALSLGVADFLAKPVTKLSLLAALERVGAGRRPLDPPRRGTSESGA